MRLRTANKKAKRRIERELKAALSEALFYETLLQYRKSVRESFEKQLFGPSEPAGIIHAPLTFNGILPTTRP